RRAAADALAGLVPVPGDLAAVLNRERKGLVCEYPYPGDAGEHWYELLAEPLPGGAGGAVIMHRDVTQRKQMQTQAQQRYQAETRVAKVPALGELAAALAHELRQPLAAILSNSQAAQRFLTAEQPDLEEARQILADINADDKRAVDILRRIRGLIHREE